ncbi:MAG: zf-HC2 domain-containing protein [Ilumatobacteraceae bacterium]|jgi:hypothetical protein|nr:zf-HC2 domain-containing protein [Ilumatobacteraceae bacterium]
MTDDLTLRASAYLDGELDPVERAAVEADPAAMTEVERLRFVAGVVRDVPAPSDAAREGAIAAALAELAPAPSRAGAIPVPARQRSTQRWLAVAAALVAVAGLGVVATAVVGGDDDTDEASDAQTLEAPAATEAPAAAVAEAESSVDDASADRSSEAAEGATPEALTAAPAGTEAPQGGGAEAPTDGDVATTTIATAAVVSTPDELAAYVASVPPVEGPDVAATYSTGCDEWADAPTIGLVDALDAVTGELVPSVVVERADGSYAAVGVGTCDVVVATEP